MLSHSDDYTGVCIDLYASGFSNLCLGGFQLYDDKNGSRRISVFSHPPTPGLCRLDRVSCLALRCDSSSRGGRAGPGSKRHALALGTGTTPGAGPRQSTDRGCTLAHLQNMQ